METQYKLFNSSEKKEVLRAEPQRPLAKVSDFVIEQLPSTLDEIRRGQLSSLSLMEEVHSLITDLPQNIIDRAARIPKESDLAELDIKMLEAAIVHSGAEPPHNLVSLVDIFSSINDQPPSLTYEGIVLVNPLSDRRTFTRGRVGLVEEDFYEGHRRIEIHLEDTIDSCLAAIDELYRNHDANKASQLLANTMNGMTAVNNYMDQIGMDMFPEDFTIFRQYLGSHPIRKLKGPSGAFTGRIPILELLMAGEKLPSFYYSYLEENRMYFPRDGRRGIAQAIHLAQSGLSLIALVEEISNPQELTFSLLQLSNFIRMFRGKHYKGVMNQIPGAISGQLIGTGGEINPGVFLRKRMNIHHI